jgi:hypothetical protein
LKVFFHFPVSRANLFEGSDFALSGLMFCFYTQLSQGFATVLPDFALSGLNIIKALKGRNTLTMGEVHRNETITFSSPERAK